MDDILNSIKGLLEPIAEQNWHGKWRIKKAIELCSTKQSESIGKRVMYTDGTPSREYEKYPTKTPS